MTDEPHPRIALIIPNYWDGDCILETLNSVQEDESIDVVVVDDATPDPTVIEKLRGYRDEGLISKLVELDENVGASRAVNAGVAATEAEYVCTFANDDLLVPGALGTLADSIAESQDAVFAVGHFAYFGARSGVRRSAAWDPWRALGRNAWPGSMMIRRDVFLRLGGLSTECIAQDWDLYLSLAEHGHAGIVVDQVVYRYRVERTGNRLSSAARRAYRDEARTMRRRHAALFAREQELRRKSRAGWAEKLFWTAMIRLAPHRPPLLTDAFFLVGAARTRAMRLFRNAG